MLTTDRPDIILLSAILLPIPAWVFWLRTKTASNPVSLDMGMGTREWMLASIRPDIILLSPILLSIPAFAFWVVRLIG